MSSSLHAIHSQRHSCFYHIVTPAREKPFIFVLAILTLAGLTIASVGLAGRLDGILTLNELASSVMTFVGIAGSLTSLALIGKIIISRTRRFRAGDLSVSETSSSVSYQPNLVSENQAAVRRSEEIISQNQQIPPHFLINVRAYLFNPNYIRFVEISSRDQVYWIWFDPLYSCIYIQGEKAYHQKSQDDKLGILIDKKGYIISVFESGRECFGSLAIPEKYLYILIDFCKFTPLATSSYNINSLSVGIYDRPQLVLEIELVRRSLKERPIYHLYELCKAIQAARRAYVLPQIHVKFLKDDLSLAQGVDGGGLTRDYLNDLFAGFIECEDLRLHKIKETSLYIPEVSRASSEDGYGRKWIVFLTEPEKDFYANLGFLLHFCYVYNGVSGASYAIGRYFPDALFKAVLSLTRGEILTPFENLPFSTYLKICKNLAEGYEESMFDRWIALLLASNNPSDKNVLEAADIAFYAGFLANDLLTENETPDREKILKNGDRVMHQLRDALFTREGSYGVFGKQLAPIHAIALGMRSFDSSTEGNFWESFRGNIFYKELSLQIQGSMNREEIVSHIQLDVDLIGTIREEIAKKTEWLKEWILYEASDEEVSKTLKFFTGSSSFSTGVTIHVRKQADDFIPLPRARTCTPEIELSPIQTGSKNGYNDFSKANFIKSFRELALTDPCSYFTA
jgi:hypothetical protein